MLETIEAPGGAGLQVRCPNCSRFHDATDVPSNCKRCGTAMKAVAPSKPLDMSTVPN